MRRIILVLIYGSLLLSLAACSKPEQANNNSQATPSASGSPESATKQPPANIVTASATEVPVAAGGSAEVAVQVRIADGYHINGNPASKYQIATTLDVAPASGIIVGQPQYPPSLTRKFSFSPEPIAVYEGEAIIKVQLKADASAAKGAQTLRAKLRVQPCDEQACYPPRNIETSIPIAVK
jgi:DsbC/DsbD-like thiol-disulfide interchange protein